MQESPPSNMEWLSTIELGYADMPTPSPDSRVCFHCRQSPASSNDGTSNSDSNNGNTNDNDNNNTPPPTTTPPLLVCSQCRVAAYCSKACQAHHWKTHKSACASYRRVGPTQQLTQVSDQQQALVEIWHRLRFYAAPYAVVQAQALGRGCVFLQSTSTLAALSLATPQDVCGHILWNRSVVVHYLTLGEFDAEVCRDDFEMALMRPALQQAVGAYDEQTHMVCLWRFRCGHVALVQTPLVPDYRVCCTLGKEYYASHPTAACLELQLDDV
jgi:MYND finger